MSAYLNALREEATREELLREVERQQRRADEAWNEALEEAARLGDAAEQRVMRKLRALEKPNVDLAGAAAVGAADMAEKLARRIRALKRE